MCINQEIVLTRVLTKQVVLYLLSILVAILYQPGDCTYKASCTRIHIVNVHLYKVATHPFAL